jgi:hypothetical protein
MLYHFTGHRIFENVDDTSALGGLRAVLQYGNLGVPVFFVISALLSRTALRIHVLMAVISRRSLSGALFAWTRRTDWQLWRLLAERCSAA